MPSTHRHTLRTNNNAPLHRSISTKRLKRAFIVLLAFVALAVPVWLTRAAVTNAWLKPRPAAPASLSHSNAKRSVNAALVAAGTIYVDDSWGSLALHDDPAGPATDFGVDSFATIQQGVNAAAPGDTVFVYAGSYTEQLTISKNLTLTGENTATTVLHTPATLTPRISPASLALVQIDTSAVVEISGLTISGPYATANACADPTYYGILVIGGANLNLHDAAVTDIQLTPAGLHGCQTGIAIRAGWQVQTQTGTLTVNNAAITGYQKSAIVVDNTGSSGTITNNTITGLGLENIAANAIQISRGAGATITGNNITANECTNPVCGSNPLTDTTSTGVLVFSTSAVLQINNNTISNNDVGVYNNGDNTTISGNTMVANRYDGIYQDQGNATITGNTLTGPMNVGITAVSFNGNTGNSTATLTGNTITGATTGLQLVDQTNADAFVPQLTAHFNRIVSGTTAIDNLSNQPIDLKNNWWGCNGGPTIAGCGTVTGTGADFTPWFVVSAQAVPDSMTPGGTSNVSVDMTHTSDNAVPATPVPATPVSYDATPNGTMTPATGTITAGAATSQFTSTTSNSATINVTIDNQNIPLAITVTAPSFSIDDVTHKEGNPPGTTAYVFTVTKTGATGLSSSVQFTTQDGSATLADSDYVFQTGTLNFGPSVTTMQVTVTVNKDATLEPNETFIVHLSAPSGATISDADGTGTITNDDPPANVVYVDDDWVGLTPGTDPAGPATNFGYDAFATIQEGLDAVAIGGTVIVADGSYVENPSVNRAVSIRGANFGVAGAGVRGPESIVRTNGNQLAVFLVTAANVTIDGFTIDGDDPALSGLPLASGDNTNASYGVRPNSAAVNHLNVSNNIIKRVEIGLRGDVASQGNVINQNWFDSIGHYDFGYCVSIRANFYADVTNNKMTRAWTGVHINFHHTATGPATFPITGNEIHSYAGGILYWLQFNGATGATINGNTITAESGAVANNFGVLMVSIQDALNPTFTNNTITGHNYGVGLFNVPTSNTITLGSTNSIVNSSLAGVFLTDNLNFNPVGLTVFGMGAASTVNVNNLSISGNTGDGVKVEGQATSQTLSISGSTITGNSGTNGVELVATNSHVSLTGSTVTGFATGVSLQNSSGATAHFNRIISGTKAIDNPNSQTVDLENNWWGCNGGPNSSGCGTVTGTGADFTPWFVVSALAVPNSTTPGATSTISVDLTHNSDTLVPGSTPPNTPVSYDAAPNGTMTPATGTITAGAASSQFASTTASSANVVVTVDNQILNLPITITPPSFSIDDVTINEGVSGTTSFTFTITKTGAGAASVDYATANGTAIEPSDYTAISSTTLSFASGDASKQVTVQVKGDTTYEVDETFTVHLSNAVGGSIADADGLGTIMNDDTCSTPTTVYVDDSWATGIAIGDDPDGAGLATSFGCDSFATIQQGVAAVAIGGNVVINAGTYNEDVNANKAGVSLLGAGSSSVSVVGPIGGPTSTIVIAASNVTVAGMTITRAGNNPTDWNGALNTGGISIQGQAVTGAVIRDNILTGNRTGIDINDSNGHTVRNNSITDNRTGMIMRNRTDNLTVVENFITNNWTVGVLFLDASNVGAPVQSALGGKFNNNDLSGNWYGQIVDRQSGGSLPAPGTTNLKNFTGNWFGTATPATTTAPTTEPGYSGLIPVEFGGTATPPGGQPDIAGPASANFKIDPLLTVGTDTNVETTPGRGTNGFQGVAINQTVVVEPSNLQGWFDFDDFPGTGTGSGGFIDGPGTAPLGAGSYFLTVDALGRHAVGTAAYAGTRMDDITELKYQSYQNNNAATAVAIALQFDIDYDLNDSVNTYFGRLVFEPYIGHAINPVQQGVWQNWDAMAGNWYGTRLTVTVNGVAGVAQPCQMATPCTWAQVLSLFPNAGVGNTPARALLFKAGGPVGVGGFNGNVDDFSIKVNTAKKTYDFEPNPHLSINSVSHSEGNAGTTNYDFTVTLSRASSSTVTVDYATANDSAVAPGDFTAIGTTQLTFNPGDTSKTITVQVNGDVTNESNEQFFVNLSNPSATADITGSQGVGTIVNDDAQPSFSIDDVTHNEGNAGTTNFTFTVTKTGATELPTSVQFQTVDGAATIADNDYASQSGPLNFGPADTTMQVTVLVNGDVTIEPTEAFTVHLSAPSGATISDADGTGTITNDDRSAPNVVYVDDSWVGTPLGTDPDAGAGPATEFGYDAFATIQEGVNAVAAGGTVNVYAGNYPENVTVPKSVSLLGPNASVDPNTGTRVAEAVVRPAVTETSVQASTSGTIFRLGTGSGHIDVTLKGFTLDGNNPLLTGGRTLNGVQVHTGAGIINSVGSFDTNPGAHDVKMIVQNNIIQNLERYGVLADGVPSPVPSAGTDVSFNKIDNLPSGNNFTGERGRGVAFEENVYGSCNSNVMTRVNVGWQDDNYYLASPGAGTVVDNNEIHAYHRGIFHNLQYQNATPATISNNKTFAETTGDFSASSTNFGLELASIASAVGVTVTNNNSTGNVYGVLIWNVPTTNTITVSGGTLTGNQYGVLATFTDPQFGAGAAGHVVISNVTVSGATVAGMAADGAGASMEVTGSTITSSAKGVVIRNGAVGNAITGNSIHDNTGLGIDLGDDGVTPNDPNDVDSGPNNLQNFPIIGSALVGSPNTISGTLNSAPGQAFTIHLYANPTCDSSGNGEGQTLIGATTASTNGSGNAFWLLNPASLNAGDFITATATDSAGNTSEFSACFQARAFTAGTLTFNQVSNSETNGDHNVDVVVSRTGGSDGPVTVQYNVTDGTATLADNDYSIAAPSGPLTWADGDASDRLITISVKGDSKFEADETVLLTLSNPTGGASIGGTNPALTITNDDAVPSFSIDDVTLAEGNGPSPTAYVFTVTKTGNTALNASVNFQTADNSATLSGGDYQSQTGTLTFLPADTTKTVTVLVNGDTTAELDETFALNLSGATNATISDNQGVGTVTNDDTDVSIAVSPATVLEDGVTNLVYTFTRNGNTTGALTANFSVAGGATFGTDYTQTGAAAFTATSGTVTFAAGNSTATVTIDPSTDATVELDETVALTLTGGAGYSVGTPGAATATITNDDTDVSVAVSPATVLEDGAANLVYTFTRNGNTTGALTANFSVAGGATFGTDYTQSGAAAFTATSGSVTFAAGNSTATVTIDPTTDGVVELDETAILTVTSGTGYSVGAPDAATGTITNDDTDVSVVVSPATVLEDGTTNLVYTFTRNGNTTGALTANFSVAGGATFGTDYTQSGAAAFTTTSGTVTFAAGNPTATVTIDPSTDATVELDETVALTLTGGTGYSVGTPGAATATITNDDTDVSVAVSPATVLEDGAANLVYTFTRNGITTGALTANFSVAGGATFGTDYTQSGAAAFTTTSGTVTFAAGSSTATLTIDPTTDTTVELDETAILTVTSGTGYSVGTPGAATGTITNDDTDVSVAVSPATVLEDGVTNLVYTFTRNGNTTGALTANFSVAGGATFGTDYTQSGAAAFTATSGTVTFAAGNSTATVTIDPSVDATVENDETVILTVTSGTGYNVATPGAATGTITNDDTDVTLSVSPASVSEDGAANLVYTFTRNGITTGALTANFSVAGGATFGTDYTQSGAAAFTATTGTVTFAAGNSTATVTIDPSVDATVENDETVILTVTSGTGYNVATPGAATGTITNDDTDVTLSVSPASVSEDGATNLVYTFTRNGNTTAALTTNFSVAGTATFATDYTQSGAATFTATTGTMTFAAGSSTATVTIDPTADPTVESDETVVLTLTAGTGYNVATPATATGTITNDEGDVSIAVSPATVPEDGTTNLVYTFTRGGVNTDPLTVNFTVAGAATFNSDYTQSGAATFTTTNGTVTFAAGSSTATVTIDPTTDVTVEPDETVILTVAPGTGYGVGSPSAVTGTIVNDDGTTGGTLQFSAASYNTAEGSFFTIITVRRLGDTTGAVSVDYATADDSAATTVIPCETASGIASPRCDFTTAVGTLHWAAGDNAPKSFIVLISEDDYVEGPEALTLTLSNPTGGAHLGSPATASLTIDDDVAEPKENPIDGPPDFVRQHYHDFLNREPDPAGFDFWVGNFPPCNGDPQCIEVKRINVSASFYLSIEFQGTGFFVERLYKSSYGDATGTSTIGGPHTLPVPIVKFSEFLPDTQEIGRGVVVLAPGWEDALEANKVAFTQQFVQRARFLNAYPLSMTPAQFVDALNANAGSPLSTAERNQLVSDLTGGAKTRAQVLRAIADDQDLINAEFNRGFVLMQYFGFLRRNPNAAPDLDHSGYDFWLKKLNQFNGNFIEAEMVKAFLTSIEYRARSGRN